jgi:hypothetical protein
MDFALFLSPPDAERVRRTVEKLCRHSVAPLVLAGGMAIELHLLRLGLPGAVRPLNDIDFLVNSFVDIPETMSADFLFRHVHPHDPPEKTLLQCVEPETAVRVDIFRASGRTTVRAAGVELFGETLRMISIEDLTARTARLCMDLADNMPVPAKHARDFLRLLPLMNMDALEPVWQEHRKRTHPESFVATTDLLRDLIATRTDLQIVPAFSQDIQRRCCRCEDTEAFPLADAGQIRSLLGYC